MNSPVLEMARLVRRAFSERLIVANDNGPVMVIHREEADRFLAMLDRLVKAAEQ